MDEPSDYISIANLEDPAKCIIINQEEQQAKEQGKPFVYFYEFKQQEWW